jgi:hypothetical protein
MYILSIYSNIIKVTNYCFVVQKSDRLIPDFTIFFDNVASVSCLGKDFPLTDMVGRSDQPFLLHLSGHEFTFLCRVFYPAFGTITPSPMRGAGLLGLFPSGRGEESGGSGGAGGLRSAGRAGTITPSPIRGVGLLRWCSSEREAEKGGGAGWAAGRAGAIAPSPMRGVGLLR